LKRRKRALQIPPGASVDLAWRKANAIQRDLGGKHFVDDGG
jgi:hypothetical protein